MLKFEHPFDILLLYFSAKRNNTLKKAYIRRVKSSGPLIKQTPL